MSTITTEQVVQEIQSEIPAEALENIQPMRLSDLIRMGSRHTTQEHNWGQGDHACALAAGALAAQAFGVIKKD